MSTLARQLFRDEAGFIVSPELALIATIVVIGMVVGLSEVSHGVNNERNDVGGAFGSVDQSFRYGGLESRNGNLSSAGSRAEGLGMGR